MTNIVTSYWKRFFRALLGSHKTPSDCGSYHVQVIPIQDIRPSDPKESLVSYIVSLLESDSVMKNFTLGSYTDEFSTPHRVIKHPNELIHIVKKMSSRYNFIKFDIKNSCGEVIDVLPVFKRLDFNDMERIDIAFTELINSKNERRNLYEIETIYSKLTKKCT